MFWRRLRSFFIPSPGSIMLVWAAFFVFLLLALTILVVILSDPELNNASVLISIVAFPAAALLVGIASLAERRPGARVLLWTCFWGLLVLATLAMLISVSFQSVEELKGLSSLLCCPCSPILIGMGLVWLFFAWRARKPFQQALRAARLHRIVTMVQARGEVTLTEMSQELSIEEPEVVSLVTSLIDSGELMAFVDTEHQRVYSAAMLNEKQRRLLAMIEVQGKARLEDLASELKIGGGMLRQWIYALVQRGKLLGYADWEAGWVYHSTVDQLIGQHHCPHCGGQQEIAGKGVIQCAHCAVEVFL